MTENPWLQAITAAKTQSPQRKFSQTWDLLINLRGLDLKKPENRMNTEFQLPEGRGKDVKVAVIADSLAAAAKGVADFVIQKNDIETLARDKKQLKKIVNDHDWFLGEATVMAQVGKSLGAVLGPRGKIPKPIPPKTAIEPFVERARKTVRVVLKETPVIHTVIGSESMPDDKVAHNAEALYGFVRDKLPKGLNNIKSVYVKLTMGKPIKVEPK